MRKTTIEHKFEIGDEVYFYLIKYPDARNQNYINNSAFCIKKGYVLDVTFLAKGKNQVAYKFSDSYLNEQYCFGTLDELLQCIKDTLEERFK